MVMNTIKFKKSYVINTITQLIIFDRVSQSKIGL